MPNIRFVAHVLSVLELENSGPRVFVSFLSPRPQNHDKVVLAATNGKMKRALPVCGVGHSFWSQERSVKMALGCLGKDVARCKESSYIFHLVYTFTLGCGMSCQVSATVTKYARAKGKLIHVERGSISICFAVDA